MGYIRPRSFAAAFLFAALLAACSGGGGGGGGGTPGTPVPTGSGGSTPTPKPHGSATPTPFTYVLPSASPLSPNAYNVVTNPTGLAVSVDGGSPVSAPTALPTNLAYGSHTVVITPSTPAASPFTFKLNTNAGAAHTLLYNQVVDTSGSINGTVLPPEFAIAKKTRPNLLRAAAGVPMRTFSRYQSLPMYSSSEIALHYDLTRFPSGRTFDDAERGHGIANATTIEQSSTAVTRILTLAAGQTADGAIRSFAGQPGIALADYVRLRYPLGSSSGNVQPNDTYYQLGHQWYLDTIVASAAWGYGAGKVPIAVIDTGYDPNQTEVAPAVTFSEKIISLGVSSNATDTDGHGTFLSGVASAITNNDAGFAGVAYNAPLLEFKIFSNGTSPTAQTPDEAAAIREAVKYGAKVILLAFGGVGAAGPDAVEHDAINYALSSGVVVVAASGDDGASASGLDFPAAYDGVISVGASAINDTSTPGVVNGSGNFEFVPSYSNASAGLTMVAPGGWGSQGSGDTDLIHYIENVYTTQPYSGDPVCSGAATAADCRADYAGTSPAAAQVAGTAALMLSSSGSLTPAQVMYILQSSADDIGDPNQGSGRLNAQRALAMVNKDPNPNPPIPVPHPGNLVVFAYANSGASEPVAPQIIDATYTTGILVNSTTGTFRIADIPAVPSSGGTPIPHWKIGVWYDANGDGQVGPGDYFGQTATCPTNAPCLNANGSGTITLTFIPTPNPAGTPFNGKLP
jgi:hypothetical protein